MIRDSLRTLAFAASAVAVLAALPALAQEKTIVIMQAQTGPGAFAGAGAAKGAKFAADELIAKGFFAPLKVKVVVEDDGSDRNQTVAAFNRHGRDPDVLMIVGPTIAPTAIAGGAVANELKMPFLPLTNATDTLKTGPYAFIGSQPPPVTMPELGKYVVETAKAKACVLAYHPDNQAYVELRNLIRQAVEPKGVKIVDEAALKQGDTDFSAVSTRFVAAKPDCVLLITNTPVGANLVVQMKQAGLDKSVKLIGQSGLSNPDLVKIGGAAVEGLVFMSDWPPGGGDNPMGKALAENYKKANGVDVDNWIAMGYSFFQVAAHAVKAAGPNPTREGIMQALAKSKDVPIVLGNGKYSYDENRLPHHGAVFLEVKNGQFVQAKN
jgi:branched-chain amino acid transport system substrate-binding protein